MVLLILQIYKLVFIKEALLFYLHGKGLQSFALQVNIRGLICELYGYQTILRYGNLQSYWHIITRGYLVSPSPSLHLGKLGRF